MNLENTYNDNEFEQLLDEMLMKHDPDEVDYIDFFEEY